MPPITTLLEPRFAALTLFLLGAAPGFVLMAVAPGHAWLMLPLTLLLSGLAAPGLHDIRQTRHAILRNYPILAYLRFF